MCDKKFLIPKEFIKNNKRVYKLVETADVIIEVVDAIIAHSSANLLNYAKLNYVKRIILFLNTQKAYVEQTKKMNGILS